MLYTDTNRINFTKKLTPLKNCLIWTGALSNKGYGQIRVGGRKGRLLLAHRMAYELTYGPIPKGLCCLHRCDNPRCCEPTHLWLGTKRDNTHDMMAKGRAKLTMPHHILRGEERSKKLTEAKVRKILASKGLLQRKIAERYGISTATVSDIQCRRTWAHVTQ